MADTWYYARDGQTHGPFSAAQFKAEAVAGRLGPQDAVWKEGMEKRVLAAKVKHLFTDTPSSPLAGPPEAPVILVASPAVVPDESALVARATGAPAPTVPAAPKPPQQQEARKRRVISVKGAILLSQDGTIMRFKKKCVKCGYEDTSLTTLQIPSGGARVNFFCPKCKKNHQVEIQGVG